MFRSSSSVKSFLYIYKTSEGVRKTEKISAETRDEVFAALRARGIRPIKVIAEDGSKANGAPPQPSGWRKNRLFLAILAGLGVFAALWGIFGRPPAPATPSAAGTVAPQGAVSAASQVARPLARQVISGDRERITHPPATLFPSAAERYLAYFAEPGRPLPPATVSPPDTAAFLACLQVPLRVRTDEFTEYVELVRIVTRLKDELRAYLAGGGTVTDYLAELFKRQRLEISYRDQAEEKLGELLAGRKPDLPRAYDYWLKANARLRTMGIYPLPLPESLRTYELTADLED